MDKCQHGSNITHFCIYEYCSAKEAGGCKSCLKKYHSHVGNGETIRTEEVDSLVQKFNIENSVKPKCRQLQEYVFSFFTQLKTQITQTIDIVCKGMVNKIGYPFLSNLNHLSSYKRIKNKEYKKLAAKELNKLSADCKSLNIESVTVQERQLYIEQIVKNFAAIECLERLMGQYERVAKGLCKNFRHDSSAFRKIQDLKKYLDSVLKIDRKQGQGKCQREIESKIMGSYFEGSQSNEKNSVRGQTLQLQQKKQIQLRQCSNRIQQQLQKPSVNKVAAERNGSRSKYKHMRNFSIERQSRMGESNIQPSIKVNQQTNYESKEKEILQRKEKLMKMMSLKEKSLGKAMQNSVPKKAESLLVPPPQLKYQQNFNQTPKQKINRHQQNQQSIARTPEPRKQSISNTTQQRKLVQSSIKLQTPRKHDLSIKLLSPCTGAYMKHSQSVRSLKQELTQQQKNTEAKNQEEDENQKYKYCMVRLPSNESTSSDADNFFKSYINTRTNKGSKKKFSNEDSFSIDEMGRQKNRNGMMSESTPVKIQVNGSCRVDDIVTDEEKSAGLYLMALQKADSKQVIRYLKAALSYSPRNISAAERLSFIYIEQGNAKQCLDLCNKYLSLLGRLEKPQLKKNFITNKSASLNMLGRYSQSIMLLQSQIIHFDEGKMYKNLGDAYYFVGINQKCQYNYEKAVRLNPRLDQAMYNLAVCIFSQGNYFNADVWISKALQVDGRNSEYQTLKKQIVKKLIKVNQQSQQYG